MGRARLSTPHRRSLNANRDAIINIFTQETYLKIRKGCKGSMVVLCGTVFPPHNSENFDSILRTGYPCSSIIIGGSLILNYFYVYFLKLLVNHNADQN